MAWRALARILPHCNDEFTNSSRIIHDMVAKFCRDQNFEHFKILDMALYLSLYLSISLKKF